MENLFCHTMQNMNTKLDPLLTTQVCSRKRFDPRSLNPVFCFFFRYMYRLRQIFIIVMILKSLIGQCKAILTFFYNQVIDFTT